MTPQLPGKMQRLAIGRKEQQHQHDQVERNAEDGNAFYPFAKTFLPCLVPPDKVRQTPADKDRQDAQHRKEETVFFVPQQYNDRQ